MKPRQGHISEEQLQKARRAMNRDLAKKRDTSGIVGEGIMWLLIAITFTFYPGFTLFYMTWTRKPSNTYLISNQFGYTISGLFILVGIVLLVTMGIWMWHRHKEQEG